MTVLTLSQIANFLKTTPSSYNSLTAQQRQDLIDTLAPKIAGFDGQQRPWFADWWFPVTQANLDAMNTALPPQTQVSAVTYLGVMYVNIDLATDCLGVDATYAAARPVLRTLVFTNIPNLPSLLPVTAP